MKFVYITEQFKKLILDKKIRRQFYHNPSTCGFGGGFRIYAGERAGGRADVLQIRTGGGAFGNKRKSAMFIHNTTTSDKLAKQMQKTAKMQGIDFIDAPITRTGGGGEWSAHGYVRRR